MRVNYKTIGEKFKYFIMPNKRRSEKLVKMKVKFKLSMYLIYFLCFIQVSAIEKSKKFNNQPQTKGGSEEVSAEPTMTRLVKLNQQRARLECNLAPLAAARYTRDRRQPKTSVGVATAVRHKISGDDEENEEERYEGEEKRDAESEKGNSNIKRNGNGNGDIKLSGSRQDGAVIDEMPARAVIKDKLSQLRPQRNSFGLGSQMDHHHHHNRDRDRWFSSLSTFPKEEQRRQQQQQQRGRRPTKTRTFGQIQPLISELSHTKDSGSFDFGSNSDSDLANSTQDEGGGGEEAGSYNDNEQVYLSPTDQDSVELILWYHSSKSAIKPIYTLDARQSFSQGLSSGSSSSSLQAQHEYNLAAQSKLLGEKVTTQLNEIEPQETVVDELKGDEEDDEDELDSVNSSEKQLNYYSGGKINDNTSNKSNSSISSSSSSSPLPALPDLAASNNDRFSANKKLTAGITSKHAKHFAMAKLSSRIRFRTSAKKAKAYLIIDKLEASDAGEYKCRVDFKYARTQYQQTKLEVIIPVSRIQIELSKHTTEQRVVDLWPPLEQVVANSHSLSSSPSPSSSLALLEANEDENIQLVCKAKDGWPNAKLAWFRVEWPNYLADSRLDLATKVTQLSIFPAEMESIVDDTIGEHARYLINTLSAKTATTTTTTAAQSSNKIPFYLTTQTNLNNNNSQQQQQTYSSNVNDRATNAAVTDQQWLLWMASELRGALRSLLKNLIPKQQANSDLNKSTVISILARELSSVLDAKIDSHYYPFLDTSIANNTTPKTNLRLSNNKDLIQNQHQQRELELKREQLEEAALLQILRQNKLVLFTCAASNTYDPNKFLLSLNDNELGDKLAKIRPLFKSILVQPNVRPQQIQMFLVRKQRSDSKSKSERIELTPLQKGQNLYLNLAKSSLSSSSSSLSDKQGLFEEGESEPQLQFVCQVSGSLPEAKIEWYRHTNLAQHTKNSTATTTNNNPREIEEAIKTGSLLHPRKLISDSKFETRSLIRALESTNDSVQYLGNSTTYNNSGPIQWSSVKVNTITVEDHQTVISCSALNEKFSSSSPSPSLFNCLPGNSNKDENITTTNSEQLLMNNSYCLSTSIELNITHVPSIKLELESNKRIEVIIPNQRYNLHENEQNVIGSRLAHDKPNNWNSDSEDNNNNNYNNLKDLTTINNHNHDNNSGGESDRRQQNSVNVIPMLYGHNFTLNCRVIFANPKIYEPIKWYLKHKKYSDKDSDDDDDEKLDKFEPLDKVNWLVKVVEKISSNQNRYNIIETLILQLNDNGPQSENESIQLKCEARNALGQAQSNTIKIIPGRRPRCLSSKAFKLIANDNDNINGNGNGSNSESNLTDKEMSIQCPVISDKASSKFHWLLQFGADNKKKKAIFDQDLAKTTKTKTNTNTNSINNLDATTTTTTTASNNVNSFFTSNNSISLSTLKLLLSKNNKTINDEDDGFEGLKITCFAVDKFGSNSQDPCSITPIGGQKRSDYPAIARSQCVANIIHQNNNLNINKIQKLQQQQHEPSANYSEKQAQNLTEPKQVLIIECMDESSNINNNSSQSKRVRGSKERRDELVHFDLYTKSENKFVKHLASYVKDEDSNNLSLKIDLSQESGFLSTTEKIEDQHVVVMSFTDSNNRQKQPNITLTFSNGNSNSDLISEGATNIPLSFRLPDFDQRFSRTHSSDSHFTTAIATTTTATLGHEDGRLWIISSICVVFASSVTLLLIAWICITGDSSVKNNKNKNKNQGSKVDNNASNNNNTNKLDNDSNNNGSNNTTTAGRHSTIDLTQQTEMYLVGEELQVSRPSIYHNFSNRREPLSSTSVTNIHEKQNHQQQRQDCNNLITTTNFNYNHTGLSSKRKPNPYDLLIIDSKLSNHTDEDMTKKAILLLDDDVDNLQNCRNNFLIDCDQRYRGSLRRNIGFNEIDALNQNSSTTIEKQQCRIGSDVINLHHQTSDSESNAFLKTIYHNENTTNTNSNNDSRDDCSNFICIMSASNRNSSSPEIKEIETRNNIASTLTNQKYSPGKCEFIDIERRMHHNHNHHHQFVRSPIRIITASQAAAAAAAAAQGLFNSTTGFELNSLGELTVTDESSSFIQEEGTATTTTTTDTNQSQQACNKCQIDSNIHDHLQLISNANVNYKPMSSECIECQRITMNNAPLGGNQQSIDGCGGGGGVGLSLLSSSALKNTDFDTSSSPPPPTSTTTTATATTSHQASTLRRLTTNDKNVKKRPGRVGFVDYEL